MKKSVRDQAIRTVTASLLSSPLTTAELSELSQEIMRPDFARALGQSLAGALQLSSQPELNPGRIAEKRQRDVDALVDFVQRKKLTKAQIAAFIVAAFPTYQIDTSLTARGQLAAFLKSGGTVEQFTTTWTQMGQTDPYLRGIIDRIRSNNE